MNFALCVFIENVLSNEVLITIEAIKLPTTTNKKKINGKPW